MSLFGRVRRQVARSARDVATDPLNGLFDRQRQLRESPARFKAALCGRRAGKTETAARDFEHGMASDPGSLNLYAALTIASAREILWEPMKRHNDEFRLGMKFDGSKLIASHPNGSRLIIRGTEDVRELEKVRGMHFRRIRLDECGAQRPNYLKYLVEEVLTPTLMDDPGADLWLMGTCTRTAYGYFHDVTTGVLPGWDTHRWTAKENPHMDWDGFIYGKPGSPGLLELRGWTEDNPTFKREWLAEWVADNTDKVFRFDPRRNVAQQLPQLYPGDKWVYVLAADFGVGHHTAAVVLAYPANYGRDVYVLERWQATGLAPSDAAARLRATWDRWGPRVFVGDIGGLGKGYQAEWNKHFPGIEMVAADKAKKRSALEFVSDSLYIAQSAGNWRTRRGIFVLSYDAVLALPQLQRLNAKERSEIAEACKALEEQLARLLWDEERKNFAPGQDDDLAHAFVYGVRACPSYANELEPEYPQPSLEDTRWGSIGRRPVQVPAQVAELGNAFRRRR